MSSLDVFTYADRQVRTVVIDGEPWFVLADVCSAIGVNNSRMVATRLADDEKGVSLIDTPGGRQNLTIVNESGMYVVVLRSDSPDAEPFRRWVTHEVLPAIRKTGQYGSALPSSFAEALELAAIQARQIEAKEAELVAARPKVEAYDALMDADGYYSMGTVANILGIGRTTLYRRLRALGIIQQVGRLPYSHHAHRFHISAATYTDSDGIAHTTHTPKVRPEHLDYLRRRLEERAA